MKPANVTTSLENEASMKAKAIHRLMTEVQKGWDSAKGNGWVSEEDAHRLFEVGESKDHPSK